LIASQIRNTVVERSRRHRQTRAAILWQMRCERGCQCEGSCR